MTSRTLLTASDIHVTVGATELLRGVNVHLMGEFLAVVGPNGAGKSTLLSVLAGDLKPASGTVTAAGRALSKTSTRELARFRSVLSQHSPSMLNYRTDDVVQMGRFGATDSLHDGEIVRSCFERTQTTHLRGRYFPSLSGGEQTLVNLARVLAQGTPVLMLDEPTAALDIAHQELVCRIARDCAYAGTAVVVVLHELNLAARFADRILLLERGRVRADGNPADVLCASTLSATYGHPIHVADHPLLRGVPLVLPMSDARTETPKSTNCTYESSTHVYQP